MAEDKKIATNTFTGGGNSDDSDHILPPDAFRYMSNLRIYGKRKSQIPTKVWGNTPITNTLPAGTNLGHGWGKDEENGKLYLFNYNSEGYHGIYAYDILTRAITPVLLNLIDTNNIDILKFNIDYPIYHVDIVSNELLYWVDGYNKARKTNIVKCIDKSSAGYGTVITEDLITAYKQTAVYAPTVQYFTDLTRTSNYVYALQFKFALRYYYDDGEQSNVSDYSAVALPPNESYLGQNSITFDNNGIKVTFETGSKDVSKIELLVKIGSENFVSCIILNKEQLGIPDFGVYTYSFYNDGAYNAVDPVKVARPYSFLPDKPACQAFIKSAMVYARFYEGFSAVKVMATSAVTFTPFYLPSGTVSQLNDPLLTATLLSEDEHGGIFNSWWTTVTHFVVGADVKKGNAFTIIATGGNTTPSQPQNFKYTATLTDSAETVAANIKNYLRLIDGVGTGTITNESISGGGDVSWDFTIEAHESKQPIKFNPSVTPVNYSTLLDNGLSINTIKQGASRKYGFVYEDEDGRTSLTYTSDAMLTVTPFQTETLLGQTTPIGLQQPIHTITINHKPPIWAKYWRLVRTSDTKTFIQMLIQQVNTVMVANEDTYLDMVVGSLFTYQKIHPDTILAYEFKRGDRLRLIANENTVPATPYTPYFETEVLDYTVDAREERTANIITDGTNQVEPKDGVNTEYVGKSIIINDIERLITNIAGNKYVLDHDINGDGYGSPYVALTIPSYTIVDRRGVIRIKKPQGYTIENQSLIELYRPQQNIDNTSYLDFFDFQEKFPVSDWGTANAAHVGNIQNQSGATPAIVQVTNGDAYVRNRALPTNNQDPNPQVIIEQIADPNFSDFYTSNLYNTGRVYPQDQGFGTIYFGSRVRFSNNYIEDTRINGLNDFDNTDRKDYNDAYGTITLLKFRENYLFVFKQLKSAWTPVGQRIVRDNASVELLATSDKLLNDLQYALWNGGIGNNPESYTENGNHQYIASLDSGVIIRIGQNGSEPISKTYKFDEKVRELLSIAAKFKLKIPAGFDRANDDAMWSIADYIEYIFNSGFNPGEWNTAIAAYPSGTTWAVTQQPAHSTATVIGEQIQITGTSTLGADFFKFRGTLPDTSLTPVMNFCFNVVEQQNRQISYKLDNTTLYCVKLYGNDVRSQDFTKNDCGSGETGSVVTYTVAANTYTANNQADADALAQADIDTNGQTYANDHGTCTPTIVYNSVQKSGTFQKDCSGTPGTAGTYEEYIVIAGAYTSTISQADANAQAQADVDANGQAYANSQGTCIVSSKRGTFLIDFYDDPDADLCFYCDTPGVTESNIPVTARANNGGTGVARYPNDGRDPATCYLLSSDRLLLSANVKMRFGVNMAYFISEYPGIDHFTFIMRGRTVSAGGCTGLYALRTVAQGYLAMQPATGEPTKDIPTVIGASPAATAYSSNIVSGGNGTTGVAVGSPVLKLDYIVSTDSFTITTY